MLGELEAIGRIKAAGHDRHGRPAIGLPEQTAAAESAEAALRGGGRAVPGEPERLGDPELGKSRGCGMHEAAGLPPAHAAMAGDDITQRPGDFVANRAAEAASSRRHQTFESGAAAFFFAMNSFSASSL